MKRLKLNRNLLVIPVLIISNAAASQDSVSKTPVLNLSYFSSDNKIPYLLVQSKWKISKKFEPAQGIAVKLYLDSVSSTLALNDKVNTGESGEAIVLIPPSLQTAWEAAAKHKFIAEATGNKDFDGISSEVEITKAKIEIDTSTDGGTKNITAIVTELQNGKWLPAKGVEMKIGVKRLQSDLKVGDDESYTTDSTGSVKAEFKRDSLPGDDKGNILLVAKVEDNDQYGNLSVKKTVPWGVVIKHKNTFNERSLFATRNKTPIWLLFMAYLIIGIVWGTLIYLIIQLFKIKKLGKEIS
ncbi:MAG TPA: hypothetical protein VET23_05775 [Chitinophagaceae bacterium]|nr:hypothetical protein [Chitinophagaceae bacterium]